MTDAEQSTVTAADILTALEERASRLCSASELPALYGRRRVDFWTVDPVGRNETVSYEIKVSRSDFLSDSREKQAFALSISERLFYVTPKGLIRKDEVPEWAGLQEWDGKRFVTRVKAPRREIPEAPSWLLLASVIRSSTRVRRDTWALMDELNARRRWANQHQKEKREETEWHRKACAKLMELGVNPYADFTPMEPAALEEQS